MTETRKSFDEALAELNSDVVRLAAMVGEAVTAGTRALLDRDLGLMEQVISNDQGADELHHSIELRAYQILARQQPTAVDLRTLLAILRILHELELSGNLMVSVTKGARRLYPVELQPRIRGLIERMGSQATVQLRLAVDAFAERDSSRAGALPDMDDAMDDLHKQLFRAIFESYTGDEAGLQQAVQIALFGRYYERVADHAVQIGRWVGFMVSGELPSAEPTPLDFATGS